jgi:macrolide-specific efflux system membrane fusion protein
MSLKKRKQRLSIDALRYVASAALILLAVAGCRPSEGAAARPIAEVEVVSSTDQVQASGGVKPQVGAEVRVGARISGTLKRLHARVGQMVHAGEVLAELDTSQLEAALAQERADRENAEVSYRLAAEAHQRISAMAQNGTVSRERLRESELAEMQAAAALRKSRAAENAARIELSYATIRAPMSGTVASISTQTGETVAASLASPTFVTIIDLERLQVIAFVDEVDISRVKVGQEVLFTADAVPNRDFHGAVQAINPAARVRENVVSFEVVISIVDDTERRLRPEMSVSVNIVTGSPHEVLTVPTDAIQRDGSRTFVEVVSATGAPQKRWVDVAREEGGRAEIRSGLTRGERVLRKPHDQKEQN